MGGGERELQKKEVEISWKELGKHNKEGDAWISIRGKVYNVSDWANKHPGGKDIILLNAGKDATQLFEAYHSLNTFQILKKFQIGVLSDSELPQYPPMSKFYKVLKKRVDQYFIDNQLSPRSSPFLLTVSVLLFFGFFLTYSLSLLLLENHIYLAIFLALITGWLSALISLIPVHEASHASLTRSPWTWRLLGATHDIANGASFYMWCHQHFLGHHPFTNVEGADPDIWVNDPDIRRILQNQKPLPHYKLQFLYAPLLYGLLAAKFRINDMVMWCITRMNGKIRVNPAGNWQTFIFFAGKVNFIFFRFLLPLFWVELSQYWKVFLVATIVDMFCSYYLAFVFQVSHVVPQVAWPQHSENQKDKSHHVEEKTTDEEDETEEENVPIGVQLLDVDWAEAQLKTTIDYGHGSPLTAFLSGGLNYQVTHHLFPGISQAHYPAIAPIVKKTAEEFGLPYIVLPNFYEAFLQHIEYLRIMGVSGLHID